MFYFYFFKTKWAVSIAKRFSSHVNGTCDGLVSRFLQVQLVDMHGVCIGNGPMSPFITCMTNPNEEPKRMKAFLWQESWAHTMVLWSQFLGFKASIGLMPMFIKWVEFESITSMCVHVQSSRLTVIYWHSKLFLVFSITHF